MTVALLCSFNQAVLDVESWGRDVYLCRDEAELRARLERLRRRRWFRGVAVLEERVDRYSNPRPPA